MKSVYTVTVTFRCSWPGCLDHPDTEPTVFSKSHFGLAESATEAKSHGIPSVVGMVYCSPEIIGTQARKVANLT